MTTMKQASVSLQIPIGIVTHIYKFSQSVFGDANYAWFTYPHDSVSTSLSMEVSASMEIGWQ